MEKSITATPESAWTPAQQLIELPIPNADGEKLVALVRQVPLHVLREGLDALQGQLTASERTELGEVLKVDVARRNELLEEMDAREWKIISLGVLAPTFKHRATDDGPGVPLSDIHPTNRQALLEGIADISGMGLTEEGKQIATFRRVGVGRNGVGEPAAGGVRAPGDAERAPGAEDAAAGGAPVLRNDPAGSPGA